MNEEEQLIAGTDLPRWYHGRFGVTPRAEAGEPIDLPPQFLARWAYWEAQEQARQEDEHDVPTH